MALLTFTEALRLALREEMVADPSVVLWGEDVGRFGGLQGVTRELLDEFGVLRVRDTPVSEAAITSLAVGAAMAGLRPVVEIMFAGLLPIAAEAILNQAAKTRYRTGGQWSVPLVVRTRCGSSPGRGPIGAESYINLFVGVPGLIVMAPGTPSSARSMLRAAIRIDDPVLFLEHAQLYRTRGEVAENLAETHKGLAAVLRAGTDATVVAVMAMVPQALLAAEELSRDGIEIEVIDPCILFPCDMETIFSSIRRTGRLVFVQDWPVFGGLAAEIVTQAESLGYLSLPAIRLGLPLVVFPQAAHLARPLIPTASSISAAVRSLLNGNSAQQ